MTEADWANIQENEGGEFPRPAPGGYIAFITDYEDVERAPAPGKKDQYLRCYWDFYDGPFKGYNRETYKRLGFWEHHATFIRSYKDSALPFFKAFKTCLESSNRGYRFNTDRLEELRLKYIGIVLGEEEYQANDGTIKKRLYVAQLRSVQAIQKGEFKVPELKKFKGAAPAPAAPMQMGGPAPAPAPMQMGAPAANPWGAAPAGAPMQMGAPAPAANPWGAPANAWATPAGAPMDKPIGVVTPTAGGPAPMPGTMVTSNQVATTGPAPMQPTQANVPPAAPAPTGDAPAKDFKA
jgi:hypothetical protein